MLSCSCCGTRLCRSKIGIGPDDLMFSRCQAACTYSLIRPLRTGFSVDPLSTEVSCDDAGSVVFAVRDALSDALVRPGSVVVHLVLGQDGAQMRVAGDQDPVQELAAQGADEALAGRVHSGEP